MLRFLMSRVPEGVLIHPIQVWTAWFFLGNSLLRNVLLFRQISAWLLGFNREDVMTLKLRYLIASIWLLGHPQWGFQYLLSVVYVNAWSGVATLGRTPNLTCHWNWLLVYQTFHCWRVLFVPTGVLTHYLVWVSALLGLLFDIKNTGGELSNMLIIDKVFISIDWNPFLLRIVI